MVYESLCDIDKEESIYGDINLEERPCFSLVVTSDGAATGFDEKQ